MDFAAITIANLIWILYSLTEGVKDSLFSHYKTTSKRKCDLDSKTLFNTQRALVLLSTAGLLIWTLGWISIPFIIGQIFMYKYFHKISHDITTKKLDSKVVEEEKSPIKKVKENSTVLTGVIIQVFSYIFLI
jgi:hypothetical protein